MCALARSMRETRHIALPAVQPVAYAVTEWLLVVSGWSVTHEGLLQPFSIAQVGGAKSVMPDAMRAGPAGLAAQLEDTHDTSMFIGGINLLCSCR